MAAADYMTRQQVLARVRQDFREEEVTRVMQSLEKLQEPFLQMSVLRMVNGSFNAIQQWIDLASQDSRDLLVAVHRQYGTGWETGFVPFERK